MAAEVQHTWEMAAEVQHIKELGLVFNNLKTLIPRTACSEANLQTRRDKNNTDVHGNAMSADSHHDTFRTREGRFVW